MRPHKLIMTAFGPFLKETTVDFDAMGDSIYLICGDTGAGKTTIFDAIVYALYGTASGDGRSKLATEAFHCDLAKDGTHRGEMRVDFTFSNGSRTLTVTRRMYWGKKGDAQKAIKESYLSENGNTLVSGKGKEDRDDVTGKVTELLGLDADQFRRIIMLAQGEFRKFLEAGSDKRGEILGKLYDNRRHQDFQLRLKAADALAEKEERKLRDEAEAQLKVLVLPEDLSEEIKEKIAADHPEMMDTVRAATEKLKRSLDAVTESIREKTEEFNRMAAQKTQAETQNGLLNDLEARKNSLKALQGQKEEKDRLRELTGLARAAEKVLQFEKAGSTAKKDWDEILKEIGALETKRQELEQSLDTLQKASEETAVKLQPEITVLNERQSSLRGILHFYDDLDQSTHGYAEKKKAWEKAARDHKTASGKLEQLKTRNEELTETLSKLDAAGEAAVRNAETVLTQLKKREQDLDGLQSDAASIKPFFDERKKSEEEWKRAENAAVEAEAEHLGVYAAFVRGQAGRLAGELRKELETKDSVICPVCGARHTKADSIRFAVADRAEIPDQETLDRALKKMTDAAGRAKDTKTRYEKQAAVCEEKKNALVKKAAELIGTADWESFHDLKALKEAVRVCRTQIGEAERNYEKAVSEKAAKDAAAAEKTVLREKITAAETNEKQLETAVNDKKTAMETAATSVENWKKQLNGQPETKAAAEKEILSLQETAGSLQKQIDAAAKAVTDCRNRQAENAGNRSRAEQEKIHRQERKATAAEEFAAALSRQNFADEAAYRKALSPQGEALTAAELTEWIAEKQQSLDLYDASLSELGAAVKQLEESTAGMVRTDLKKLTERIGALNHEIEDLRKSESGFSSAVRTNLQVYGRLGKIGQSRRKYLHVLEKLKPLADTANGNYAFSRFVLNDFFHRIIDQANVHLEIMTDGEYSLIPVETGDGRKTLGLDLRVLNTITGLERETPSLSGGQSFEASLALALGLSDVVQMESASTIRIDSMFIDEGFGSLDGARLDKAIGVLRHLSDGKRQIGIISHVARLEECLDRKIRVVTGSAGSTIKTETDQ